MRRFWGQPVMGVTSPVLPAAQGGSSRRGASFTFANRAERLIWSACWRLLARWTPAKLNTWRIFLLRLFGAEIGRGAAIASSVRVWLPRHLRLGESVTLGPDVDCYNMGLLEIGSHTIVSQRAVLCGGTHDVTDAHFQLEARPVKIGERAWIAAEAFVGPGAVIGDGAVLGARACAFGVLEPWTIYAGNPARATRARCLRTEKGDLGDGS